MRNSAPHYIGMTWHQIKPNYLINVLLPEQCCKWFQHSLKGNKTEALDCTVFNASNILL